jgi:hypothetical protein
MKEEELLKTGKYKIQNETTKRKLSTNSIFYDLEEREGKTFKNQYRNAWLKAIGTLTIGMGIWFFSTLLNGGYLGVPSLELSLVSMILLLIIYFIVWIGVMILADLQYNLVAMVIFFVAAYLSGLLEYPVMVWAGDLVGLQRAKELFFMASLTGVLSTLGVLMIGHLLRDKLRGKMGKILFVIVVVYGILLIILEFLLILIFGFDQVIFFTSILVLIWVYGVILYDGMNLVDEIHRNEWMNAVVGIFLDLVIVIIRIFLILVKLEEN